MAVNVTVVPEQIGPGVPVMETPGVTASVTVIAVVVADAVAGEAHGALDVIITVTRSPLLREEVVNVLFVSPDTFTPLICH